MIDLTVNKKVLEKNVKRAKEKGIVIHVCTDEESGYYSG